jgi:hypothetical protein
VLAELAEAMTEAQRHAPSGELLAAV